MSSEEEEWPVLIEGLVRDLNRKRSLYERRGVRAEIKFLRSEINAKFLISEPRELNARLSV